MVTATTVAAATAAGFINKHQQEYQVLHLSPLYYNIRRSSAHADCERNIEI